MLKISCFLSAFFFYTICFGSSTSSSDPGIKQDSIIEKIVSLNKTAKRLNRDATNQAIAYAYKAYLMAFENKLKIQQAEALVILAEGYLYNDIYELALEYGFNALEIYKGKSTVEQIGSTYTVLGWTYYDVGNAELSLKYHTMAYNLYKKAGYEEKASVSLNGIGLTYQLMNEFKKAAEYFNQVLVLAKKFNKEQLISAAYNNLGISSNNASDYKQAIRYFQLALKHSTRELLSLAEIQNQMSYSFVRLGRYQEAEVSLNKAFGYIEKSTSNSKKENLLDYYKIFSQLYQVRGDYKHAYEYIQKYNSVKEDLLSQNKINALLTLTMKRETQEKEQQIKELNLEKSLKSYQRNTLAIIVVLLIIIGFLLFNKLRSRQKKNAELSEMKQQLLSNKLEFNHSELKNYSMYMTHKNEVISNFIEELIVLEKGGGLDLIPRLHKLINKFRYDMNSEKYIEDFNLQIETKYQDFFYNLQQKFPKLTQNERRLCAQIRLNLSIKEIASLNNISDKSVEMARYRLRKHFGLSTNDSLNDFLKAF
jgi:tetratricopeptide (TPR) repeat protein